MKRASHHNSFTLIEVMIVVAVIGLLAAIAMPMISKARTTTQMNICLDNQRILYEAVGLYELELRTNLNSIANNGVSVRNAIMAAGYVVKSNAFDCPASGTLDFDDYQLRYSGTTLTGTYCTIQPTLHVLK